MDQDDFDNGAMETNAGSTDGENPHPEAFAGESASEIINLSHSGTTIEDRMARITLTVESSAEEQQSPSLPYPVVAFGASAGGLQAFREILENLNPTTGMAFVLVTHLAPDQKSFLSEIIERYTQMPVHSIEDGQRPNRITFTSCFPTRR